MKTISYIFIKHDFFWLPKRVIVHILAVTATGNWRNVKQYLFDSIVVLSPRKPWSGKVHKTQEARSGAICFTANTDPLQYLQLAFALIQHVMLLLLLLGQKTHKWGMWMVDIYCYCNRFAEVWSWKEKHSIMFSFRLSEVLQCKTFLFYTQ